MPLVLGSTQVNAAIDEDLAPTLPSAMGTGGGHVPMVLAVHENQLSECRLSEMCPPLQTPSGKAGRGLPVVLQEAYRISSDASNCMRSGNPHSGINKADLAPTVDTTDPSPSKGQGGIAIVTEDIPPPHCFKIRSGCDGGGKGYLGQDNKSFTLATGNDQYMMTEARVRKLTPIECERLQGFSDNYTQIPWKGKPAEECPDSPRYKAIGNSWCVPCVRWIGERIQKELDLLEK